MAVQWYSVEDQDAQDRVVAAWGSAPIENLEVLGYLLTTAREQVIAYAPALDPEADPPAEYPERYALAQLNLATDLWNAGRTDASGSTGSEGFFYKPLSLSKETMRIIRPVDGRPHVL